jgi:membrane protein YdbS with pleckstrin-like domain
MKLPKISFPTRSKLLRVVRGIALIWILLLIAFWLMNIIFVIWYKDWTNPPFQNMFFAILIPLLMRWKLVISPYEIDFEVTATSNKD